MVLNEILYNIDPNTMLLGLLFIIFYGLINIALSRVFKKERSTSTVISLCVSLLAVYGINRTNLDLSGLFSKVGLNDTLIYAVVPWIILGLAVLGSFAKDQTGRRSFRFYRLFMILGAFLILLSFFAYQTAVVLIVGIVLVVLGIIISLRKNRGNSQVQRRPLPKAGNLFLWIIFLALVALAIYATLNKINYLIIGAAAGLLIVGIILFSKKKDNVISSGQKSSNQNQGSSKQGEDYLIKAAKRFHDWAKAQKNPKFAGSWAMFIKYLGGNEEAICQRLQISKNDFVGIFNQYGLVR